MFSKIAEKLRNSQTLKDSKAAIDAFSLGEKVVFLSLLIIFASSLYFIFQNLEEKISVEIPAFGGTLDEGIVGPPRFINPLITVTDSDRDITSLIYSGLMKADPNGRLVTDLAQEYTISEDGLTYIFKIKNNAVFHDGSPVTADDIIYTISMAQNPDIKSPKRANWENVLAEKIDDHTVSFTLAQPYSPFIENTTLGILPKHIWEGATADVFAYSQYNIEPIGSGPFELSSIKRNSSGVPTIYNLKSFDDYALGKPYTESLRLHFYSNEKALIEALKKGEVTGAAGLSPSSIEELEDDGLNIEQYPLPRVIAFYLNQNEEKAFVDRDVRIALNLSLDRERIIRDVLSGQGQAIDSPIPAGLLPIETIGSKTATSSIPWDIEKAKTILANDGWKIGDDGILSKTEKKEITRLEFSISTNDNPSLKRVAEIAKENWESLGAKVEIKIFDTNTFRQNAIAERKYDALLFGTIIGRDLDFYGYWHSSQRNDPGLNLSMYTNAKVDKLLTEGRETSDENERIKKYADFEAEIKNDLPAIFVYTPNFVYVLPNELKGFNIGHITTPAERFSTVHTWYEETERVWTFLAPYLSQIK